MCLEPMGEAQLEAGFGGFYSGEGFDHGVDFGVAQDCLDAVVETGEEEGAAFVLGGNEVGREEAYAGGVDVGDFGEVEDEDLWGEGAELSLEGEHGGERDRAGELEDGCAVVFAGGGGEGQRCITHCGSVRTVMLQEGECRD